MSIDDSAEYDAALSIRRVEYALMSRTQWSMR